MWFSKTNQKQNKINQKHSYNNKIFHMAMKYITAPLFHRCFRDFPPFAAAADELLEPLQHRSASKGISLHIQDDHDAQHLSNRRM
jgi:hypothetical protein